MTDTLPTPPRYPSLDPQSPWTAHAVRIAGIRHEVEGIATYQLAFEDPELASRYRFTAGQFNMLYLPGIGEAAISISSDPNHPETLLHTVRVVGSVTRALARMKVGAPLLLRGPFGAGWPVDACQGRDLVIATGGVGLAPLRPVLYELIHRRQDFGRVILLYGARTARDLLYTSEFSAWRDANIEVEVTVDLGDEDWQGHIGVVPSLFQRLRLDAPRTSVLTCGPEIMMHYVAFEALARKVPARSIFLSMERNMNCALGHCGHCQLGPEFICKDGPVFSYERLRPYLNVEDF